MRARIARGLAAGWLLWAAGCGASEGAAGPLPEPRTHAYRECSVDADCVYTYNGCCDCMNGGTDIAVRRDQLEAFRGQFQCGGQGCTEMGGECGTGTVACEQGLCVYRAK
jgi:hypothetical protein